MADSVIHIEPLRPWARCGLFAAVVFFHVGAGWALTRIHLDPIDAGDPASMQVSFVTEQVPQPVPEPPQEQRLEPPQLESMIQPPTPDLAPPEFPVPKPLPKPVVHPNPAPRAQVTPTPPAPSAPTPTPARNTGPKTVSVSQVAYLDNPPPAYPARAKRRGDSGTVMLSVLIDSAGRPAKVAVRTSSGHPELDESAMSGVRGWRFKPYTDAGMPEAVWVEIPINFVLQ